MNLTLIEKRKEAGEAVTFIFQPETPATWKAGQFMHYVLPHENPDDRGIERWFTNSAAPFEQHIRVTTRILAVEEHPSTFKQALHALPVGAKIESDGPDGDFIVTDLEAEYVFIAGGIGITPYRSILLDLDHGGVDIKATLLYANRNQDFIFKDELEVLKARHPHFQIHYFVEPERINETVIKARVANIAQPLFYTSGPEPMVQAFEKMLSGMGIPENRSRRDEFPGYSWP